MLKSVEGVYRDGKIELTEVPEDMPDQTRVIITFLESTPGVLDLRSLGIDEAHAAELRARFGLITEDWDSPEMDIYDDYDANKAALPAGRRRSGSVS